MTQAQPSLRPATPPETLYHGTSAEAVTSILIEGLSPMMREHVHLSAEPGHARQFATGPGKPAVFTVYARSAHDEGQTFWLSDNGVWLTGPVPPEYLYLPPTRGAE